MSSTDIIPMSNPALAGSPKTATCENEEGDPPRVCSVARKRQNNSEASSDREKRGWLGVRLVLVKS